MSYVVPVKSKVKISKNIEALSEYMNFKWNCQILKKILESESFQFSDKIWKNRW